jgi:hypothetical protein
MDSNLEDCCSICGEDFKNEYCHTLKCNHKFHYNCLQLTFKNLRCNHCPYCRGKNNYLPVVNGLKKLHIGVHVTSYEEVEKYSNLNKPCNTILKRGKNKGNECGKNCQLGYDKCKMHNKESNELINFSFNNSNSNN